MKQLNQSLGRRTVLKGAGLGLVAGGISAALPVQNAGAATESDEIWSGEYWTKKGEVNLNIYRKRVGAPVAGEKSRPLLFMVHGSSNSARTSYDLQTPGIGEY